MIEYIVIILGVSIFGGLHSGVSALRVKNRLIDRFGKEGYSRIFNGTSILSFLLAVLSMGTVDWLSILNLASVNIVLLLSGVFLLSLSLYIAMLASRAISVSTVADMRTDRKAELVTNGLYSRIRHPLYLATVLMFTSLVLIYPFPKVALFSLGMIVYLIIGAKLEERKLIHHYGDEYTQYMQQAGFLLPRL